MRTPPKSTEPQRAAKSSGGQAPDAVDLLISDHKEVKKLFKDYDKLAEAKAGDDERQAIADEICAKLTVHAQVEEEIFYPATREAFNDKDDALVDEAEVEHASAKDLIAQIQGMSPSEDLYDAKVKVLGEMIDHHVKEEEGEMFPKVKKLKVDTASLGVLMQARKEELTEETNIKDAVTLPPKRH